MALRRSTQWWITVVGAPLLVATVGALVAGLAVPALRDGGTKSREDLDRVVKSMNGATADVISTGEMFADQVVEKETPDPSERQRRYDAALGNWNRRKEEIDGQLATHFKKYQPEWRTFSDRVTDLYYLSASGIGAEERCARAQRVTTYLLGQSARRLSCEAKLPMTLRELDANCDQAERKIRTVPWDSLAYCDLDGRPQYPAPYDRHAAYGDFYRTAGTRMLAKEKALVQEISS